MNNLEIRRTRISIFIITNTLNSIATFVEYTKRFHNTLSFSKVKFSLRNSVYKIKNPNRILLLKEIVSSMKITSTGEKMERPGATQSLGKGTSVRTLARYWLKEAARQYQLLSTVSRMIFELSKSSICTSYTR